MYNVLFISFINWDSLMEIPAVLRNGGCNVDIFCTKDQWVLQNKYYNNFIKGSEDGNLFVDQLINYVQTNGQRYDWIIPGDDIIIRMLNERITNEELFYKIMPLTKMENRDLLGSKKGFQELCDKYEILAPKYLIYENGMSADTAADYVGFPMMVKLDKSEGGFGVWMCNNKSELQNTLDAVKDKSNLVFQQFIKGYEVNTELLCRNGELIVYNYSKRLKTIGKFGVSTQRDYYLNEAVETELQRISRQLGLNGFCNVVFMFNELDQRHYLIEVDARPNSWMYYGKFTGNNFSEGVKKITNGDCTLMKPDRKYSGKHTKVCLYKKDVFRCLFEKDFGELAKWTLNTDGRWKYIPLYDYRTFASSTKFLWGKFNEFFFQKLERDYQLHFALPKFTLNTKWMPHLHMPSFR